MTRAALVVWLVALAGPLSAAEPKVIFEDRFTGKLADGWVWLKQDPKSWRLRDGALELRILPQQVNILARTLPDPADGPFAVEMTVTNVPQLQRQYEQVGFFWYADGKPGPKFVKEMIDGTVYVFPGKKPAAEATVGMRLVVDGKNYTAQYRPGGKGAYQPAFTAPVPPAEKGKLQVAVTCFHGPTDAEHWVRITAFRIVRLPASR
ncbi:MAG: hypothetical protein U0736_06330 [Gemmataceae bacterium]